MLHAAQRCSIIPLHIVKHIEASPATDLLNIVVVLLLTTCAQDCPLVQDLNAYKLATNPQTSSLTSRIFAVLFPGTPAVNALLATLYISGPPSKAIIVPNLHAGALTHLRLPLGIMPSQH